MSEQLRRLIPPQLYPHHFTQIAFRTTFSNCVHRALTLRKWKEVENASWTLQWCEKQKINDVFEQGISSNQRVNHFRLYTQLCKKDLMIKNIKKYKRQLAKQGKLKEQQWNFHPLTFFLPSQYTMFIQQFRKYGGLWIMKPTGRCQGSGIFLVNKLSQVLPYKQKVTHPPNPNKPSPQVKIKKVQQNSQDQQEQDNVKQQQEIQINESYIIQKYIANPLLFGSKKFDLRIYALCTNYSSLTVWLYRSGFARFTHQPYDGENIDNLNSHLTNVQIQKHSQNYDEVRGGKWFLDCFKHFLCSKYGLISVNKCFTGIKEIIIKTLRSVQKSILPSKSSFQLYGYDFMIDNQLKPWLIQINGGPSMTANTDFDCKLKCGLIDDVLTIIDCQGIRSGNQQTVGGFDIILHNDIPVVEHPNQLYSTKLGCRNNRIKVIRSIAHSFLLRNQKENNRNKQQFKDINDIKNNKDIVIQKSKKDSKTKPQSVQIPIKNKLLPNFYYVRKTGEINETSKKQLQQLLQILEQQTQQDDDSFLTIGKAKQLRL